MEKYINNVKAKIIKYMEENKQFDLDDCFKNCVGPNVCKRITLKYLSNYIKGV